MKNNQTLPSISVIFTYMIVTLFYLSCKNVDSTAINLMPYGIPYKVEAPESAKVRKLSAGNLTSLSINDDSLYNLVVIMEPATTSDIEKCKVKRKIEVSNDPYFIKIVEEYEDGFLFEKSVDGTNRTFDFRIVKLVGSSEIVFQAGDNKLNSESSVKAMLTSLRTKQ